MEIDFGPRLGVKRSSAQLADLYRPEDLEGRQVVALVDLEEKRIAGFVSQVLVLGVQTDAGVVLLCPDRPVPDGLEVF
jgi:tRNA-binding protein